MMSDRDRHAGHDQIGEKDDMRRGVIDTPESETVEQIPDHQEDRRQMPLIAVREGDDCVEPCGQSHCGRYFCPARP
jgi:hypothetical protein